MLEQNGMLGIRVENELPPASPQAPTRPKIFSPDKMTPAEMIGAGAVMLGNVAFISWWAMNDGAPEIIEMIDTPTNVQSVPTLIVPPQPSLELAEGSSSEAILEVADVQQEGTFKEAFDAARAQVGPGGIFEWHGQWYNTYTAEEWTSMAPEGKEDYATLIKPFLEEGGNAHPATLEYDALSGQEHHVEIAHTDATTYHGVHLEGHTDVIDVMPHVPVDTQLDTLDDLFLNT